MGTAVLANGLTDSQSPPALSKHGLQSGRLTVIPGCGGAQVDEGPVPLPSSRLRAEWACRMEAVGTSHPVLGLAGWAPLKGLFLHVKQVAAFAPTLGLQPHFFWAERGGLWMPEISHLPGPMPRAVVPSCPSPLPRPLRPSLSSQETELPAKPNSGVEGPSSLGHHLPGGSHTTARSALC